MPELCSKLAYYAGIMLNALASLLCLKLCQHNRRRPTINNDNTDQDVIIKGLTHFQDFDLALYMTVNLDKKAATIPTQK